MSFPLTTGDLSSLGLDKQSLDRLSETITRHLTEGRYPGAQIAVARRGKLALVQTFGDARLDPGRAAARDETLWLLYSNTKVITACAVWLLMERGALRFTDRVAEHLPGFEQNGKGDITIVQLLTHQGGFPNADVPKEAWEDHDLLRRAVCGFTLESSPGSRVHYHGRAAHWTAAAMIEAITKTDFAPSSVTHRRTVRSGARAFVGLLDLSMDAVDMHEPSADGSSLVKRGRRTSPSSAGRARRAAAATPRRAAAFYQMLQGGTPNGKRLLSPRTIEYVTRNFTGDRVDAHGHADAPGLSWHVRGTRDHSLSARSYRRVRSVTAALDRPTVGRSDSGVSLLFDQRPTARPPALGALDVTALCTYGDQRGELTVCGRGLRVSSTEPSHSHVEVTHGTQNQQRSS
jgi:CubicO group peptidase (beta-lactamase class C family)